MANTRQQLTVALNQFYHQPVARVSFELFLTIGAVIFFAIFAIRPTLLTMADLIKEIEDKRQLDQQLNQKIAALSTAQSEYLTVQNRLPLLDEALPEYPDLITALKIFEKLASENSLVISNLTVNEIPPEMQTTGAPTIESLAAAEQPATNSKTDTKRKVVLATMTVTGDYPVIRQFVDDIRQTRRSFIIDSIVFSTSEEKGQKKLKATITIAVPYFSTS